MESKSLGKADICGESFSKEMLAGDMTAGINFDRLQKHPIHGYMIFEYQKCEPTQIVTPHTSHPNRYWHKCRRKYKRIWEVACILGAKLFVVNYAERGTIHENLVRLLLVEEVDEQGIKTKFEKCMTRNEFSRWFRKYNQECLTEGY
jgi:hypothetical protein